MKRILLIACMLALCSCRSQQLPVKATQQTEQETTESATTTTGIDFRQSIDKAVRQTVDEIRQRMSEMEWQYSKTDYSPPDSTGKQHATATEQGKLTNKTQESSDRKEQADTQYKEVAQMLATYDGKIDRMETSLQNIETEQKARLAWYQSVLIALGSLLLIDISIKVYLRLKKK